MKGTRNLSLSYLLGTTFVLFSAAAGTGWLYGPDDFLMCTAQSRPSSSLDVAFGFLSAFGSLEVTGALLLTLTAGLSLGGQRGLAGRLLLAFLATGLLEYLLKQFLPVPPVPTGFARTQDVAPLIVADHSYPYPSGHALRSTILLGTVYVLKQERPTASWGSAGTARVVGESSLSRDALDFGRRGRGVVGYYRRAVGFRERGLARAAEN